MPPCDARALGLPLCSAGRQCAHPDDSLEASSEPRLSFPADCSSNRCPLFTRQRVVLLIAP